MTRRFIIAYNGMETGLGNRLRVILSSQILAGQEKRRLYYVWPTGPRFGPAFRELFVVPAGGVLPRSVSRGLAKIYPYVDESLDWLDDRKRRERVWQIRTGAALNLPPGSESWGERLRHLGPVDEIAERVQSTYQAELAGRPYVGVMVRSHEVSHGETKRASPVEWYLERLGQVRAQLPDVRLFLSCDRADVGEELSRRFGNCVLLRDKGDYNTTAGVRSAVVDLYLLASSQHLIGPHHSSFIQLAQELNGNQVPIETSKTAEAPIVDLEAIPAVRDPLRPWARGDSR